MMERLLWCLLGFDVERKHCSCVPKQEATKKLIPNFVQCSLYFMYSPCHAPICLCRVWRAKDISDEVYKRGECSRGSEGRNWVACEWEGRPLAVTGQGRWGKDAKTLFSSRPVQCLVLFSRQRIRRGEI